MVLFLLLSCRVFVCFTCAVFFNLGECVDVPEDPNTMLAESAHEIIEYAILASQRNPVSNGFGDGREANGERTGAREGEETKGRSERASRKGDRSREGGQESRREGKGRVAS